MEENRRELKTEEQEEQSQKMGNWWSSSKSNQHSRSSRRQHERKLCRLKGQNNVLRASGLALVMIETHEGIPNRAVM